MLSRRALLASAALAPAFAAADDPKETKPVAPSDKLTLGFVGVGTMGRGHLGGFLGRSDVEVLAVCDVVAERKLAAMDQVKKRYADRKKSGSYNGVAGYRDFRDLLDHPGLDAVVIATPDHWHAIPAVLAARAGKPVYCEKPLTQNLADGRWIADEVKKAGIIFQTGSQQRTEFGGHFRTAVEYVWAGRIGKLKTVRIGVGGPAVACDLPTETVPPGTDWDLWLGPAPVRGYHSDLCPKGVHKHFPAWRKYREYGGGGLADMGAHHFDIAQWAMKMDGSGPVEVVPPADPNKTSGLRFVYASGVTMIHNEFEGDRKADCVFEGTDGTILVSRTGIKSIPDNILKTPLVEKDERAYPAKDHKANWLDCIRSKKPCICPAEVGHRSASICHLGNIGYQVRRPLKWDPVRERFVNDAAADKLLSREPRSQWKV